jgi:hypothetical protein
METVTAPAEAASKDLAPTEPAEPAPVHAEPTSAATSVAETADDTPDEPASEATDERRAGHNRTLTLTGLGLAAIAELYLQLGDATNRTKSIGLGILVAGAVLFALGAAAGVLPSQFRRVRLPMLPPNRVFRPGPSAVAGAVGGMAFNTLMGRLLIGSTVAIGAPGGSSVSAEIAGPARVGTASVRTAAAPLPVGCGSTCSAGGTVVAASGDRSGAGAGSVGPGAAGVCAWIGTDWPAGLSRPPQASQKT